MRFTCREPGTRGICLRQVEWRMLSAAAASGWAWQWMEEAADDGERKDGRLKIQQRAGLDLSFAPSLVCGLRSSAPDAWNTASRNTA